MKKVSCPDILKKANGKTLLSPDQNVPKNKCSKKMIHNTATFPLLNVEGDKTPEQKVNGWPVEKVNPSANAMF